MTGLIAAVAGFAEDEDGATALEYGLIAALVAVGCLVAIGLFGGSLTGLFVNVQTKSSAAMDSAGT